MTLSASSLNEEVSNQELEAILKSLNNIFSRYGIVVKFMSHFRDRINDVRNKSPITRQTMIELFNKLLQATNLRKLSSMKNGQEGVMVYKSTNFVYTLEQPPGSKVHQLRFITAMDKDRFRSNSPSDFYLRLESFSEFYERIKK